MEEKTTGVVISVKKQWWFKVNTKPIRTGALDGAVFPHIIKVKYTAEGREYTKSKWIGAGKDTPDVDSAVSVIYRKDKPSKAKII